MHVSRVFVLWTVLACTSEMVLATCGVWGAYRVSKWRGPELGGIGLGGMLAVPVGRPLGTSRRPGCPSGVGAEPSPAGSCRARGGGVVRGTASRAPVVSRVWRRRFEPQLENPIMHQPSGVKPQTRLPENDKRPPRTRHVSHCAPTRTHSELMTLCDHILMGRSSGRSCSESELPYVPAISSMPQERLPAAAAY